MITTPDIRLMTPGPRIIAWLVVLLLLATIVVQPAPVQPVPVLSDDVQTLHSTLSAVTASTAQIPAAPVDSLPAPIPVVAPQPIPAAALPPLTSSPAPHDFIPSQASTAPAPLIPAGADGRADRSAMPSIAGGIALPLAFQSADALLGPQGASNVRYLAQSRMGSLFFLDTSVVLNLPSGAPVADVPSATTTRAAVDSVQLQFLLTSPNVQVQAADQLPGRVNYYVGSDRSAWKTDLAMYAGVVYHGLYPGVDLHYAGAEGNLKGTYTIAPGADPSHITWAYRGTSSASIDPATGDLHLGLPGQAGHVLEKAPVAWQIIDGQRVGVDVRYRVEHGTIGFVVAPYDTAVPLVIDPEIVYATYLGAAPNADYIRGIAVRANGTELYIAGNATGIFPIGTITPDPATYTSTPSGIDLSITTQGLSNVGFT